MIDQEPINAQLLFCVFLRDVSSNQLKTFHRDTFRHLYYLSTLDLSINVLDYLPPGIFDDLQNLELL